LEVTTVNKTFLNRLAALESRQAPSDDTGSIESVRRQLAIIRERREAQSRWWRRSP
jgi:hypothetical protein